METKSYWIKAQDVLNIISDEVDRSNEENISAEYAEALNNAYLALSTLVKFW